MKHLPFIALLLTCFLLSGFVRSQKINENILKEPWNASWVEVPDASPNGYGVYLFRKSINLNERPVTFIAHISADNRYKLFINEKEVSLGPARGDLEHWNFATLDLAPFLQKGRNIIAAIVWNEGAWRAEGQISLRTGFILQGDDKASAVINTNDEWKCMRDPSITPLPFKTNTYYVAGPGEIVDMNRQSRGWAAADFPDSGWLHAKILQPGLPKNVLGGYGTIPGWQLIPADIPPMEMKEQRLSKVVMSTGVTVPTGFPSEKISLTIPANTIADILLDQGFLANAYPQLTFSGGRDGTISLGYAEALFTKYPSKGNRNQTDGKYFLGREDSILADGSREQFFTSLSFRTYRYLRLHITTKEDPLILSDIKGMATGYPFEMNARLESDNPELKKMMEIGWRTARLCAMETYMDCPYYEQLQYIGDARIQALVSLFNSGDDRLLRNAMNQMDYSRRPEGITLSRHPSSTPQYIPPFSLWYIGMLHDYMMYGKDSNFIKAKLPGERQVIQYFRNYQQQDGSVSGVPYWMFTDWVETKGWTSGVGPVGKDGSSALIDLQLLWAYELAADMESKMGMSAYSKLYLQEADRLKKTIKAKYWSFERKLFADRPEKDLYSQHANALAILTGLVTNRESAAIGNQLLTDTTLAPASIYFKYYLHAALVKAGMGNDYLNWLGIWRENIKMGMTTWAEISDISNTRSDCHAWGASPNIEFFRTVLGIESDAPGFARVRLEPRPGSLKYIRGEIPHPNGKLKVSFQFETGVWKIQIELPGTVTGTLIWKGKTYPLKPGLNFYNIKA